MKIFRVGIEGIGRYPADRDRRIFVSAEEVSHIHQKSKIGMVDGGDELFNPLAVLYKGSMVLYHGFYAFFGGILRYLAARAGDNGKDGVKALVSSLWIPDCGIMANAGEPSATAISISPFTR